MDAKLAIFENCGLICAIQKNVEFARMLIFNYQYLFLIKIQNNGGTINEYYNLNENTELVYMKVTSAIMRLINTYNNNVAARLLVLTKNCTRS